MPKTKEPAKPKARKDQVPAAAEPAAPPDPAAEALEQAGKALAMDCHEVSYRIGSLPTSRSTSDMTKIKMADVVGGKKRGFSVSKKLFSSEHPLVADLNAARAEIDAWRDSWTIVKSDEVEDADGRLRVAAGVRLIRTDDIAEFDAGFGVRVERLLAAAAKIQEHMRTPYMFKGKLFASILDTDKERLGDEFNEADYPADVSECIRVTAPNYAAYAVSVKLPPEIYKRQENRLHEAMTKSIEVATAAWTDTLLDTFTTLAGQLSTRTRVYPNDKALARFREAEVVKTATRGADVVVTLRYREADPDAPGRQRSVVVDLDPMPEKEYASRLCPMTTTERKKVSTSVVEGLMTKLADFEKVGTMLGAPGEKIREALGKVRQMLSYAGSSADQIADEIRSSSSFRAQLSGVLEGVAADLGDAAEEVRVVRRRLSSKLIGNI